MLTNFETYLAHSLDHLEEGVLKDAMQYALVAPGKRLRVRLLFEALRAYGLDEEVGYPIATAIEMVHTYSLIHDDLPAMDDDAMRRGRPTLHILYDEATAILAGDALLTEAFWYLSQTRSPYIAEMLRLFSASCGAQGMVLGQMKDIAAEQQTISLDQLQEIHQFKTGKLIALPLLMAAYLADATADVAIWNQIGQTIGLAFQIQDDILDKTASSDQLGKTAGKDELAEKSTYVSLMGLQEAQHKTQELLEKAMALLDQLDRSTPSMVALLRTLVERNK
ncbi:MAG: polyprenyl synthetase family protein [Erysipelotrichaceae bacterium]